MKLERSKRRRERRRRDGQLAFLLSVCQPAELEVLFSRRVPLRTVRQERALVLDPRCA